MDLPLSASVPTALARAQFLVLASVSVLVAMYAPALMVIRAIHTFPVAVRVRKKTITYYINHSRVFLFIAKYKNYTISGIHRAADGNSYINLIDLSTNLHITLYLLH